MLFFFQLESFIFCDYGPFFLSVEAVVTFDYDAVQDDELTLKTGQTITNITVMEEGWWEGEVNGQRGLFPDNFVEVCWVTAFLMQISKENLIRRPLDCHSSTLQTEQLGLWFAFILYIFIYKITPPQKKRRNRE